MLRQLGSGTEVTVYNNNLALVKEKRELDLDSGVNRVEYTDVAALIDPTSVMFEDTKNKDTAVLEQNYEYDLVSSQKLLEKVPGQGNYCNRKRRRHIYRDFAEL